MNTSKLTLAFTVLVMFLTACGKKQVQTDLYFGMNTPGGAVTEEQWKDFSENVIAKHFPIGSTEWFGRGRYKHPETKETIVESTKVVTLVGDKGAERDKAVQAVVDEYRRRFKLQAVFRVETEVDATLIVGN